MDQQPTSFGHCLRPLFGLKPGFTQLNHGSYGTVPKPVLESLRQFQDRAEQNSKTWFHRDLTLYLTKVRSELGAHLNANPSDLVIVPNATSGMNSIFRSLTYSPGDLILHFSTVYPAMGKLIQFIVDSNHGQVKALEFQAVFPISNEELLRDLETFVDQHHGVIRGQGQRIRIALIDHISSTPGVILPIGQIIPMLRSRGILVAIDGAHAIGQIPIDLSNLNPDFWVSNAHKWLFSARGTAVFYVKYHQQSMIHPPQISENYSRAGLRFQEEFLETGTRDFSPHLTVTAALEFRRSLGGEVVIQNYNHRLALQGAKFLATKFRTRILQETNEDESQIGNLVDVQLPLNNPEDPRLTHFYWVNKLLDDYPEIYVVVHKHGGHWWLRLSVQIYNELSDFEVAGRIFGEICSRINDGSEWMSLREGKPATSSHEIHCRVPRDPDPENQLQVKVIVPPKFGRSLRSQFLFDPHFIQMDHGGYGTYPKSVQEALRAFQDRCEGNPERWFIREVELILERVRGRLALLLNAQTSDLVMVPNTTSGINAILRSFPFQSGDHILQFNTGQIGVTEIVNFVCDQSHGRVKPIRFPLTYPITNEALLDNLIKFLEENQPNCQKIRLAIIDHISSVPGVILPIQQIIPILKARGILVLVDGAHAIGQVPIDLTSLNPHFYISNIHKWLFGARGSAVLWVHHDLQPSIHPDLISNRYRVPTDFIQEFFWIGTRDFGSLLSVEASLDFRESLGGEGVIQGHNHNLALAGGQVVATKLKTRILQAPDQIGSMIDIQLPIYEDCKIGLTKQWWNHKLLEECPSIFLKVYSHGGHWWTRLSAQVYNDLTDFEVAGQVLKKVCLEVNSGLHNLGG